MRIFGLVLAGGAGRRMGGADKALLPLAGRSLLWHCLARLEPQVEAAALSANGDAARFAGFGLPVLPDDMTSLGPLSGLLSGLRWAAARGASALVTASVDSPFLPGDLVPQLCLAAEGAASGVALAESGGKMHPTFGLWPVTVEPALRGFLASGAKPRVLDFARAQGAVPAAFPDPEAFLNINTPEDLARAEILIGGGT